MLTKTKANELSKGSSGASSFETVALREMAVLYRVARRMTLDADDAEDLVGQVLLLAARAWPTFDGQHPRSWLMRILKNEFYKRKIANRRHLSLDDHEDPASEELVEKRIGDRFTARAIIDALDRIPEEYRMAVALCDGEEMSYEEAAVALDIPMGTLRSRLFRGRRLLQRKLQGWREP